MVFYNNRITIANVNGKEIYVVKGLKNELILHYYSNDGNIVESVLAYDLLEEFDVLIYEEFIYLVYQDLEYYLNLLIINGDEMSAHRLTAEGMPRIVDLNILSHNDKVSIFYLYPMDRSLKRYQIEHCILEDDSWKKFLVDEVLVEKVLNPIKVINIGKDILIAYYYENQICVKCFTDGMWKESIVLTDNKEKLYLDLIYYGRYIHLAYSEAIEDNYMIRYVKFSYPILIKESSSIISRKNNPTNPTIIMKNNLLWIIWNESSRIYSRYSYNIGKTWSDIKNWDEAIKNNTVRYKYITNQQMKDTIIHNSFGTIYPDIKFIGFY